MGKKWNEKWNKSGNCRKEKFFHLFIHDIIINFNYSTLCQSSYSFWGVLTMSGAASGRIAAQMEWSWWTRRFGKLSRKLCCNENCEEKITPSPSILVSQPPPPPHPLIMFLFSETLHFSNITWIIYEKMNN